MDLLQHLYKELPARITLENKAGKYVFDLQFIINHGEDCEYLLSYGLESDNRPFYNTFLGYNAGFLYAVEGIENDDDLIEAIAETKAFLIENKLI